MTNEQIKEQLELALENLDCHTPEENVRILFKMLTDGLKDLKKSANDLD